MRQVLGDGLRAPQVYPPEKVEYMADLFVLGPSTKPHAAFASEPVLEVEVDGRQFHIPANLVKEMIDKCLAALRPGPAEGDAT